MFKTFKQFIGEDMPSAGGPPPMPNAGNPAQPGAPTAPAQASGASSALTQQSQSLAVQIQQINQKLQKLMQQKAAVDKQIGTANSTTNAQASANISTVAATQATPGQ